MMNSESMQLPLLFGTNQASVAFAVDARPVMFSFTIPPVEVTVTRGVRNPGMVPKVIRWARSTLTLDSALKLLALDVVLAKASAGWAREDHWAKLIYSSIKDYLGIPQ